MSAASLEDAAGILRRLVASGKVSEEDVRDAATVTERATPSAAPTADTAGAGRRKKGEAKAKAKAREGKAVSPTPSYRYRHVALRVHYDGATYGGLAENVGDPADCSVERELFAALRRTCLIEGKGETGTHGPPPSHAATDGDDQGHGGGRGCGYSRAGRTDKGVSAFGQVVALRLRSAVPPGSRMAVPPGEGGEGMEAGPGRDVAEEDLPASSEPGKGLDYWVPPRQKTRVKRKSDQSGGDGTATAAGASPPLVRRTLPEFPYPHMLNGVLPPTIRVLGWCPVTPQFSARFSCSDRTYRYHFVRRDMDLEAMDNALRRMVGRHDFRNLCKMNVLEVSNFVRVIKAARIVVPDGGAGGEGGEGRRLVTCHIEIVGQAFLWHQIRCLVAVLFLVGRGLEKPGIVDALLDIDANPGKPSYPMASEMPLVLHRCAYGGDAKDRVPFRCSALELWGVSCDLERRWEDLALAAARLRDGLASLETEATVTAADVDRFVAEVARERERKGRRRRAPTAGAAPILALAAPTAAREATRLSWGDALDEISSRLGMRPTPDGARTNLHVPLLERARGTTYEEKIASLKASPEAGAGDGQSMVPSKTKKTRRLERYEENAGKKKKSRDEDQKFYSHMLSQGATRAT